MILQQCYQNMRWFDMLMESVGGLIWQYDNNQSSSSNNWKPSIQHISNKWFRAGRLYRLTISFAQVNNSHFWFHENIHSESLEETLCIIALWYSIFIPFESWLYIQYSLIVIFSCIEKVNSWLFTIRCSGNSDTKIWTSTTFDKNIVHFINVPACCQNTGGLIEKSIIFD